MTSEIEIGQAVERIQQAIRNIADSSSAEVSCANLARATLLSFALATLLLEHSLLIEHCNELFPGKDHVAGQLLATLLAPRVA